MVKRGMKPSIITYNILVGFPSKNGNVNIDLELKEEMGGKGMQPECGYPCFVDGRTVLGGEV